MSGLKAVSFRRPVTPLPSKPRQLSEGTWYPWTPEEDAIIREHYPTGGVAACMPHLEKYRTPGGTYQRAALKLKLKAPFGTASNKAKGTNERIVPPEGFDDDLRAFYQNGNGKKRGECDAFADRLGLPRWWVSKRAQKLGLAMPHKKEPPWAQAELELLKHVPLHDTDRSSKIFRDHGFSRSPLSIRVKSVRQHLSRRYKETLSATGIARILGVDGKTVTREIIAGDLHATKRKTDRLPQQGGDPWSVKPVDLRRYIIANLERIDLRKVDKFAFVQIIAAEPLNPGDAK